jgi:ubiquinone/menaquinone biosynthesis C-methylase UbiE
LENQLRSVSKCAGVKSTKRRLTGVPDPRSAIVREGYDVIAERHLVWAPTIEGDPSERMLDTLMARLAPGARVLELGCGAGVRSTRRLAEHHDVTGVDISEAQLRLARARVPDASFIHADLLDLQFAPHSFDAIAAFYVLGHVPREHHAGLLHSFATWLAPGGWLLTTLGAGGIDDETENWLGVEMFFSSHDADTNRRLLAQAGFALAVDEVVTMREPEGEAGFLWVLGQTPA